MSGIWIKLYIGQSDPNPKTWKVKPESCSDIDDLRNKIKEAGQNYLVHCDAFLLDVYRQGTSVPISNQVQPIDPRDPVPRGSDPLIVIAPVNPQQQHGEFCCSFCFALCCTIQYASFVIHTSSECGGSNSGIWI